MALVICPIVVGVLVIGGVFLGSSLAGFRWLLQDDHGGGGGDPRSGGLAADYRRNRHVGCEAGINGGG